MDKEKEDVIEKLPPPTSIRANRSFLGHAGFYKKFIKDFSKIAKPLSNLLVKDVQFNFSDKCVQAFEMNAPIMVALNWNLPFKLM